MNQNDIRITSQEVKGIPTQLPQRDFFGKRKSQNSSTANLEGSRANWSGGTENSRRDYL